MDQQHAAVSRRHLAIAGLGVVLLGAIVAYQHAQGPSAPDAPGPGREISSFDECVAAGFPAMESFPRQCSDGTRSFTESVTDIETISSSGNVRVGMPSPNMALPLPFTVTGEARVFENTVNWRLTDADESVLVEGFATSDAGMPGSFGNFSFTSSYPQPKGDRGSLAIFTLSAKDGSEQDVVRIPVTFTRPETQSVQAYFGNAKRDPQTLRCEVAYPVSRRIVRTVAPARAALEELFQGPTSAERAAGSITSIPDGVRILSLAIENGTARVDLSRELKAASGGSCRVSAVRAQIESTLRQFPSVQRVTILIEGKDDALEP